MTATIPTYIVDQARNTDLGALAGRYIELRKESAVSLCGPCPWCGGTDRFWIKGNRYTCRGCGLNGDSIEFLMRKENLQFAEAVAFLTGYRGDGAQVARLANLQTPGQRKAPEQKPIEGPAGDWMAKAEQLAASAHNRLLDTPDASPGRDYLLGRGIDPGAWATFGLGYRPDAPLANTWDNEQKRYILPGQPAIVIPWWRGHGDKRQIWAIRYRFLTLQTYTDVNGSQRNEKLVAQPRSVFAGMMYGGQALPEFCYLPISDKCAESLRTLVICEGELNAISIWQAANRWNWDTLSLGSESQHLPDTMLEFAKRYDRVIVWMDRPEIVRKLMAQIPGSYGISSPVRDDKKIDANDMLKAGYLGGFLSELRSKSCKTDAERKRLYYALWDAFTEGTLDEEALVVMGKLGEQLGLVEVG